MTLPLPPRTPWQRWRDALANPGYRLLLLWVILILMFVVSYQLFASHGNGSGARRPEALGSQDGPWLTILVPYLPLLGVVAFVGLAYARSWRLAAVNKRGVDLMARGESAAAAEIFRGLARTPLGPRGVANLNLGLALLRLGDLRGALEAFALSERRRTVSKAYRPMGAAFIALCSALLGELDASERWVEEARKRSASPAANTRVHLAAEAIVRCRRGDVDGAARLLHQTWGEIERSTAADLVRAFRIVRAFAGESAGGPFAASANDLVAGARPFRAGEYAWLGAGWPEMARYLEARGFGASMA